MEQLAPRFVSAAEFTRNFGLWQDRAVEGPLIVTHHGRPRCVLLSAQAWQAMSGQGGASDRAAAPDQVHPPTEQGLLAERMDAGFVALDDHLVIRGANALGAMMLGHARETLVGLSFAEAMPGLADGAVGAQLARTLRSADEAHLTAVSDGRALHLHIFPWPEGVAMTLRAASDEDAVVHDQRAAEALRAAMAAHGRAGTAEIARDGTFRSVDPGLAAMAGYAPEHLTGIRAIDLLAPAARPALAAAIETVTAGGKPVALDSRLKIAGGGDRSARIALAPIAQADGAMMVVA